MYILPQLKNIKTTITNKTLLGFSLIVISLWFLEYRVSTCYWLFTDGKVGFNFFEQVRSWGLTWEILLIWNSLPASDLVTHISLLCFRMVLRIGGKGRLEQGLAWKPGDCAMPAPSQHWGPVNGLPLRLSPGSALLLSVVLWPCVCHSSATSASPAGVSLPSVQGRSH